MKSHPSSHHRHHCLTCQPGFFCRFAHINNSCKSFSWRKVENLIFRENLRVEFQAAKKKNKKRALDHEIVVMCDNWRRFNSSSYQAKCFRKVFTSVKVISPDLDEFHRGLEWAINLGVWGCPPEHGDMVKINSELEKKCEKTFSEEKKLIAIPSLSCRYVWEWGAWNLRRKFAVFFSFTTQRFTIESTQYLNAWKIIFLSSSLFLHRFNVRIYVDGKV